MRSGENHDVYVLPKPREKQTSVWIIGGKLHRIGDISAKFWRVGRNLPEEKRKSIR